MRKKNIVIISLVCLCASLLLFAVQKNWIIFYGHAKNITVIKQGTTKKSIKNYFWRNDKWQHEDNDIIWDNNNPTRNLEQIIKNWLAILEEESIINKKVGVHYVLLHETTGYVSFDGSPFDTEGSIHDKLKLIEGLFKTIEPYFPHLRIYFLVHNELMQDYHLDFSNPWQQTFLT